MNPGPAESAIEQRSRIMRAVRRQDTQPELAVRKLLFHLGYRFRLHEGALPGTPDIVFPSRRIAVFVHGCFWHHHSGCARATFPKSRQDYWSRKFRDNQARDERKLRELGALGWIALIVWECETADPESLAERLMRELGPTRWR